MHPIIKLSICQYYTPLTILDKQTREFSLPTCSETKKTSQNEAFFIGGEAGIRTLGRLAPATVFKTVPLDHSGTSPNINLWDV